jgi:hypothetical protein
VASNVYVLGFGGILFGGLLLLAAASGRGSRPTRVLLAVGGLAVSGCALLAVGILTTFNGAGCDRTHWDCSSADTSFAVAQILEGMGVALLAAAVTLLVIAVSVRLKRVFDHRGG